MPQLGRVILEDDVEVGANTTIDRGSRRHRDRRGLAPRQPGADRAQRPPRPVLRGGGAGGIAGSTELGDFVVVAGQAGLAGHLRIGQRAGSAPRRA